MQNITTDFDTLLRQASMTAKEYLIHAVAEIDAVMGDGTARKHPELVVAFMRTAGEDFSSAMLKLAAQDIRDGLSDIAGAIVVAIPRPQPTDQN